MKILKIVSFLIITILLFSCGSNSKQNDINSSNVSQNVGQENGKTDENNQKIVANYEKVSLKIDGMTCEIGCARTIQSKLSKANGVKLAEVSFESKTGVVEFDSSKISENQIVKIVEGIAGGDLYKVNQIEKSE